MVAPCLVHIILLFVSNSCLVLRSLRIVKAMEMIDNAMNPSLFQPAQYYGSQVLSPCGVHYLKMKFFNLLLN